jgi:hypothetical protein
LRQDFSRILLRVFPDAGHAAPFHAENRAGALERQLPQRSGTVPANAGDRGGASMSTPSPNDVAAGEAALYIPTEQPPATEVGLLSVEETVSTLQQVLGDIVPEDRLREAAFVLKQAEAARWEALPPDINPDMGFNFFVVCRETCWLARQILIEGATFRIFRLRD